MMLSDQGLFPEGLDLDSPEVIEELGEELAETLKMEIELLDGAGTN